MKRSAGAAIVVTLVGWLLAGLHTQAFARDGSGGGDRAPAAPDTTRVTLLEALERAGTTYPSVRAAGARVATARAATDRAASDRWPDLSLRASATRYEEPMIVNPIHGFEPGTTPPFDETLFEAGAYVDFTLFDFGARGARIRSSRSETSATEAGRAATEQALAADVAGTYLDVLGLDAVLEAHERRIEALAAELSRVEQLRTVGRAARVELLRVEAALANARSDREEVRASLDVAERELARLTDLPAERVRAHRLVDLAYTGSALATPAEMARRAAARNPTVERARREREASRAGVEVARSARWPELKLGGAWVDRGSAAGDFEAEWSVGVGLSLPLFTGGRLSGQIEEARARESGAQQRVRLAEKAVERAVDRAYASVSETAARVRSLERAVTAREEVVRIEKLRLETGTGIQTDYLDAEADLLTSRADLARMRYAELRARVELARATGTLDAAWIERNLEAKS